MWLYGFFTFSGLTVIVNFLLRLTFLGGKYLDKFSVVIATKVEEKHVELSHSKKFRFAAVTFTSTEKF